jgi:soluble lytic murein transglycosylase
MARVPRIAAPQPGQTAALPTPQFSFANPEQMGAGLARGMGTVAEALQQEQDKADAVQVMGAQRQLSEWRLSTIDHPETGALSKRGKDAFGLPDTIATDYDKRVGEIVGGLANDRQKQAFQKFANADRDSILRSVNRHVAGELKGYAEAENKAYVETALNAAALNFTDPERVETEVLRAKAAIMAHAKISGEPAEATNLRLTKAQSAIRRTVAERLADTDPIKAQEYLGKYADQMDADDILKVQGKVGKAVDAQVGMAVAGEVIKKIQPNMQPTEMDRAFNILIGAESGGRRGIHRDQHRHKYRRQGNGDSYPSADTDQGGNRPSAERWRPY